MPNVSKRQKLMEEEFERIKAELAPIETQEEQRVFESISEEVEAHGKILARSKALADLKVRR